MLSIVYEYTVLIPVNIILYASHVFYIKTLMIKILSRHTICAYTPVAELLADWYVYMCVL